ncbi:MAG: glucose 1-dehydrogenase [Chloroflexota bacterium]|nr:glucose 1-dehydrogenase [Chloroflexota bacterium]
MRLEGKVALVSGAARGIGAATARLFAREGARVAISDILEAEGARTAEEIRAAGGEASYVRLDVRAPDDWKRAVDATVSKYGRLDILVNNAGIQIARPSFEQVTLEDWEKVMAVNATGVFLGCKAVVEQMKRQRSGSVVNISSISGIVGISAQAAYAASKGGVRIFTKYLAIQLARYGIRANSIHPGGVETVMTNFGGTDPEARKRSIAAHPLGRLGQPEDIAYGALYLASDEASWVTGSELVIDGGYTAQ